MRALRSNAQWLASLRSRLLPGTPGRAVAYELERNGQPDDALAAWLALPPSEQDRGTIFRLTLQRARRRMQQEDWLGAAHDFECLLQLEPADFRAIRGLESASLRAARQAQTERDWLTASRMWAAYHRASGQTEKCARNLTLCARQLARNVETPAKVTDLLEAWSRLAAVDGNLPEDLQGIEWCRVNLARAAEEAGDFSTARAHWLALEAAIPDSIEAADGLARTADFEPAELVDPISNSGASVSGTPSSAPANQTEAIQESPSSLWKKFSRLNKKDYRAQFHAGSTLQRAGSPERALPFFAAAFAVKPTAEAAQHMFTCQMAIGRNSEALDTLQKMLELGGSSGPFAREFGELLQRTKPGTLEPQLLERLLQTLGGDGRVAPALLLHLIAAERHDKVARIVDSDYVESANLREDIGAAIVSYYNQRSDLHRALRAGCSFGRGTVLTTLTELARGLSVPELKDFVLANSSRTAKGSWISRLGLAELLVLLGKETDALDVLSGIASAIPEEAAEPYYLANKDRISRLFTQIAKALGNGPDVRRRLAQFVAIWLEPSSRHFIAGDKGELLAATLGAARRFEAATPSSKAGHLRDRYFAHHMERRDGQDPDAITGERCEIALKYFAALSRWIPVEAVPIPSELAESLRRNAATNGTSLPLDVLMSYAISRDRPRDRKLPEAAFADLAGWYVMRFVPANHIPSVCIGQAVRDYFNEAVFRHPTTGLAITRFLNLLWSRSEPFKRRYDLDDEVDSALFALEVIASVLPKFPQYRIFVEAAVAANDTEPSFIAECIAALASGAAVPASLFPPGLDAPSAKAPSPIGARQDVLLIGHASKETGLGRNFHMLADALRADGLALQLMDYELDTREFANQLAKWRNTCQSPPIVVLAVNAQDVPTVFVKDYRGTLERCHTVGFFLWETSEAPRVQRLGIELVDEIWAPTKYVADVYARFAPTHVVGKGLYRDSLAAVARPVRRNPNAPFKFLTVFNFDSSVERKNPLAVVQAFQRAFTGDEDVQLILKTSNVNPGHWSNALGHWERLMQACDGDSRIKILLLHYPQAQMTELMRESGCIVSLHRSEGFAYVLADAMAYGVPVIATNYSGNVDFCTDETYFPVDYDLIPIDPRVSHWKTDGAQWAEPSIESAAEQMRRVFSDYESAQKAAKAAQQKILSKYSVDLFRKTLRARLAAVRANALRPDAPR